MKFIKFTSLENTYKQKAINGIYVQGLAKGDWHVFEKVDGANLAIYYNGVEFKIASRNQFVDETFFNCGNVVKQYHEHIELILSKLMYSELEYIIVRGELYGNGIQGRINYGEKDFCLFDIDLMLTSGQLITLPWSETESLLQMANCELPDIKPLLAAPYIGTYSFEDALKVSEDFKSLLTPEGYDKDNWSEGIVIRPNEPKKYASGSRVFLKQKSMHFKEAGGPTKVRTEVVLDEFDKNRLEAVLDMVNESRVYSAVSKIGQIKRDMFGKLLGEVMSDVYKDFHEDTGVGVLDGVTNAKAVKAAFQKSAADAVRDVFKVIVED